MSNDSFRPTSIPYRTTFGEPMTYYIISDDEVHTEVSRVECLTRTDEPNNPYPQRWYVDEESGFVARLPRTQKGEELARNNMRSVWREAKTQERRYECICKGTVKCDGWKRAFDGSLECDRCQRGHTSRTVELDLLYEREDNSDGSGSDAHFDPVSDCDVAGIAEDKSLLDTLYAALALLTEDDRSLIDAIFRDGKTERTLAPELGLKEPKSVNKRKHRILEQLRQNPALKDFLE